MSQTLTQAANGLIAMLQADPDMTDWFARYADGRAPTILKTNRKVGDISNRELPCLLLELPEGEFGGAVVSGHRQSQRPVIQLTVGWRENDRDRAFEATCELPDVLGRAFLRDRGGLSDSVNSALPTKWEGSQGLHHPAHFFSVDIAVEYTTAL